MIGGRTARSSGRRRPLHLALVILVSVVPAGCSGVPSTRHYVLEASQRDRVVARALEGRQLGVAPFQVDPPYDQPRIVYREGAGSPRVGFYAYHHWAVPLSRMLPGLVADHLRGIPGISRVEPLVSGRRYDATLEGRLLALEEIDEPDGQQIRVELELRLRDRGGAEIWSRPLVARGHVRAQQVDEIVQAMASTLEDAVGQARSGLAEALKRLPAD